MATGSASHPSQARAQRNRELFECRGVLAAGPTPEVFFAKHIDNSRHCEGGRPRTQARDAHLHP